ncbi:Fe(3+)-hydroxamate ABC transporter permease FhuB [Gemmobacter serpentinus]|uniref:Fe(3+)-hydroxamate ABC transporter permease FhuB n=1 Tax=Gemmobacter serpentinus TaxID=2652247 RepID=UPI00124BEC48|nr:Fe(3+)-hydroxamate ABC transporter permease FhuB [Gemmobacter serpentinus]
MARGLLLLVCIGLALQGLWPAIIAPPASDSVAWLILTQSSLPRLAMALLAGFALSLTGEVCQRIFANPLAEPGLLGLSDGASLALSLCLLVAPGLWQAAPGLVAMLGAGAALILVLAIAWGPGLQAQSLLLAGVMVSLCSAAAQALLVLFNHDFLQALLLWQAGSLVQSGWGAGIRMGLQILPVIAALFLMQRPLQLLALGDGAASGLGVDVRAAKLILLGGAAWVTAAVMATLGMIGFIGLAGPALARGLSGRARPGMVQAGIWGGVLLLFADQVARILSGLVGDVPVGAASGLFIGPLLVMLSLRARRLGLPERGVSVAMRPLRRANPVVPWALALAVPVLILAALILGRDEGGLILHGIADLAGVVHWRMPPLLLAGGAGACLSLSGMILQKVLRNPLASPDLLGLGSGAGLAFALALIFLPGDSLISRYLVTGIGAGATLALVAALGLRAGLAPARVLLIGVGIGSSAHAFLVLVLAAGGPKGAALLSWFSGSTGGADLAQAMLPWGVAGLALALVLMLHRWFDLLALDDAIAQGRGLALRPARGLALLLAALTAAAGTIALGPVSFIGLVVPHLAASLGYRATASAALISALIGAALMILAQSLGAMLAWPWPMAPGLICAMICGPWFLWQIRRGAA